MKNLTVLYLLLKIVSFNLVIQEYFDTENSSPNDESIEVPLIVYKRKFYSQNPKLIFPIGNTRSHNMDLRGLIYQPVEIHGKGKRQSADMKSMRTDGGHNLRGQANKMQNYGNSLLWREDRSGSSHYVRANSLLRSL